MSRISKARMEKALAQLKTISPEDHAKVKGLAEIVRPLRSFIHKNAGRLRYHRLDRRRDLMRHIAEEKRTKESLENPTMKNPSRTISLAIALLGVTVLPGAPICV